MTESVLVSEQQFFFFPLRPQHDPKERLTFPSFTFVSQFVSELKESSDSSPSLSLNSQLSDNINKHFISSHLFHLILSMYPWSKKKKKRMCLQASADTAEHAVLSDLDLSLSPTGKVVKQVGDSLPVTMEKTASGDVTVSWTKVRGCGC